MEQNAVHHLGKIRMSPLMYGSLKFIGSRNSLTMEDVFALKQTQLRAFKTHQWIVELPGRNGIKITKEGKSALNFYDSNDEFFRRVARLSVTSLLNLELPGSEPPVARQPVKSAKNGFGVHRKATAA